MKFRHKGFDQETLLHMYRSMLEPRLIEEKMLVLLRQGKISKWFSGMGQEAIATGSALAMQHDEYILTMHRNLGVFTVREVPLEKLFAQWQGKTSGFTKGRDRSFHFGTHDHCIVGMISHLAAQIPVATGIALAEKLNKSKKATLVFTGDGGTSEGDFHEAMNVAAVWRLPVIVMVENNGYGLSTPSKEQFRFKSFKDKGPGYGIKALSIDGNNVLEVYRAVQKAAELVRKKPQPILIEARTFRMRGHEEASGTKYVPQKLMEKWAKKDPISNFEEFLFEKNILSEEIKATFTQEINQKIDQALKKAFREKPPVPDELLESADVYFSTNGQILMPKSEKKVKLRFVDAVSDGLRQCLQKFPKLIFKGQDIAEYGGVFKVSEGFVEDFGKDRIRNTPICESAIIGMGLGLSVKGMKSVIEMQFADFVSCGFNQIVNNLAKSHYRWGQNADVVIRMPTGAGVGAGPYHSQSNEAWFFHTPGLKIVYPSTPYYAKGLLVAAVEDPNPVLYFEHKGLYRSVSEEIPEDIYSLPIGKGRVVRDGSSLSIITYGAGVHWAAELAEQQQDLDLRIVDLVSLMPWDKELIEESIRKTNRVVILHEATLTGGIGAEIAAWISENHFHHLDAPVARVASLDTPVPFAQPLEEQFLAKSRLGKRVREILDY